jgi:soluble lytic murein transglycosylase-like protein
MALVFAAVAWLEGQGRVAGPLQASGHLERVASALVGQACWLEAATRAGGGKQFRFAFRGDNDPDGPPCLLIEEG